MDASPPVWAQQTVQGVFSTIGWGSGARVVAYETGDLNPVEPTWTTTQAIQSLVTLMAMCGMDGGSFWRWTSFENSEVLDPTLAQPIKVGWAISRHFVASVLAGLLVVSHLPADFITSRIQARRGGPAIGLGLYHYRMADFAVESTVILVGLFFYRQSLDETRRRWKVLLGMGVTLIGFLLLGDTLVAG